MGQHVDSLNEKIQATAAEIHKLTDDVQKVKTDLGRALAEGRDREADKLQQHRDSLTRALERCELRLEALKGELPAAERLDAASRLNEIAGEASALAKACEDAKQIYERALAALVASIDAAYSRVKLNKGTNSATAFRKRACNLEPYEKLAPPILTMIFRPNVGRSKSREAVVFERLFSIPMTVLGLLFNWTQHPRNGQIGSAGPTVRNPTVAKWAVRGC